MNENTSKRNETRVTDKASVKCNTYLDNQLPILIEEYYSQQSTINKLAYSNRVGMEDSSLPLVTAPASPEISAIRGSHTIRGSEISLDDATDPPVIHSKQETINDSIRGQDSRNVYLRSLKISPDVPKDGKGKNQAEW